MNKKDVALCAMLTALVSWTQADVAGFSRNINSDTENLPWFTSGGGTYSGLVDANTSSSTLISGTETFSGAGVASNVTVTADVSFTISTADGMYLVDEGLGKGLGVNNLAGDVQPSRINGGEYLYFGMISLNNINVSDPDNVLVGDVSFANIGWSVLRSSDFKESSEGAVAASDLAQTTVYAASGVSGSGSIDNNFTAGVITGTPDSFYLINTGADDWRLKGIQYSGDLEYDVVPEPATLGMLAAVAGSFVFIRRMLVS